MPLRIRPAAPFCKAGKGSSRDGCKRRTLESVMRIRLRRSGKFSNVNIAGDTKSAEATHANATVGRAWSLGWTRLFYQFQ